MPAALCTSNPVISPMSVANSQAEALQFHLEHLTWQQQLQCSELYAHVDGDSVRMMLDQAADVAIEGLMPLAASGDVAGCTLSGGRVTLPPGTREVYTQWCELGFPLLGIAQEQGGLGFPRVVVSAVQEICDGANLAFGMLSINLRCAVLA